jgi:ABC-2 type transport system permease protein
MTDSIKRLAILVRREMWESPVAFKWTPVIIFGFILLSALLALIIGMRVDGNLVFTRDGLAMFAELDAEQRNLFASGALFSISALFHQVMYLVLIFYLAGSLYDDRRDRSILFWKSLPVSDTMTVASKVLAACILAPMLYLGGIILTQLTLLLIASVIGLFADINVFSTLWVPANLPKQWTLMLYGSVVQALWLLPIYAWLIFCSSWAPRLPILIAVLVPLLIGMLQHFWSFFSNFKLPEVNLLLIMLDRIGKGVTPASIEWDQFREAGGTTIRPSADLFMNFSSVTRHLFSLEMWIGVAIGLALLAGAVWFRRRATDN